MNIGFSIQQLRPNTISDPLQEQLMEFERHLYNICFRENAWHEVACNVKTWYVENSGRSGLE